MQQPQMSQTFGVDKSVVGEFVLDTFAVGDIFLSFFVVSFPQLRDL
jgi:hypothetical protein